jgi:hypothetical protein
MTIKAPEAITQGNCGHTRVLIRDFCNQPVELNGPCIFCYRDTLQSSLERTERELREACELLNRWTNSAGRAEQEQGFTTTELHHCWTDTMQFLALSNPSNPEKGES